MARSFPGTAANIITDAGGLAAWTYGTFAVLVKRNSTGWNSLSTLHNVANQARGGLEISDNADGNHLYYQSNGVAVRSSFSVVNADNWVLLVAGKATGTATPRMHMYVYDTGTWTHQDATSTIGNTTGTCTTMRHGEWEAGDYLGGDLAWSAAWLARNLTDAEVEQLAHSLTSIVSMAPTAMWVFDQQATTQAVADLTGGGANQTSTTGTSVSASSAPVGYGHPLLIAHAVPAGGTTHNADAALAVTATLASTAAVDRAANAALTATATRTATAAVDRAANAAATTTATITSTAAVDRNAAAALTVTASVASSAAVDRSAAATATISATATATAAVDRAAAAAVVVSAGIAATAAVDRAADATLTATATVTATASVAAAASAVITATATITATASVTTPAAPAITFSVSTPRSRWHTSAPRGAWDAGPPRTRWTIRPPRGA